MNFLPEFLQDIWVWKQLALLTSSIKHWRLKTWTAEQDKIHADANAKFEKQNRNPVQETTYRFSFQGKTHLEFLITEITMLPCRSETKLH